MSEITYLDMNEFRDGGYLQEANRLFLHPLGLALEWSSGITEEAVKALVKRIVEAGEAPSLRAAQGAGHLGTTVAAAVEILRALGLDRPRISGVWDYRDDPEGVAFDDSYDLAPKAERIERLMEERRDARVDALGYFIQPVS